MFDQWFIFAGFTPRVLGSWPYSIYTFFFQGRVLGRLDAKWPEKDMRAKIWFICTQLSSDIVKNRMPGDYTTELNGGYNKPL